MALSDGDIKERIEDGDLVIEPFEPDNVEPASVDLRLGKDFKVFSGYPSDEPIDTRSEGDMLSFEPEYDSIVLEPEQFVLATTKEYVEIPDDIVAEVLGRSSLGRLGISVHQTAGFIDPGFKGQITLELSNHGPAPVKLYSDDRICQIVFQELSSKAEEPYGHSGSQYQNQEGATQSGMKFD